ncbi:MAG: Kelch repeat-containing protein [Bacteroidota bacterium]
MRSMKLIRLALCVVAVVLVAASVMAAASPITLGPPNKYGRAKCCAFVMDNKIWLVGGQGDKKVNVGIVPIEVFDLKTNTWTTLGPNSCPPAGYSSQIFAVRGKIYCLAGKYYNPADRNYKAFVFDPKTESWDELPGQATMNHYDGAGAVVGTKIYLFGGEDETLKNEGFDYAKNVDVYDTRTGKWSTMAPQPNPRQDAWALAVGSKVYIIAGQGANKDDATTRSIEIFDTRTNTWSAGKDLDFEWEVPRIVMVKDKAYILTGKGEGSSLIVQFDPKTFACKVAKTALKTLRNEGSVVEYKGKIYVIAGKNMDGKFETSMEIYDPALDTFE